LWLVFGLYFGLDCGWFLGFTLLGFVHIKTGR